MSLTFYLVIIQHSYPAISLFGDYFKDLLFTNSLIYKKNLQRKYDTNPQHPDIPTSSDVFKLFYIMLNVCCAVIKV